MNITFGISTASFADFSKGKEVLLYCADASNVIVVSDDIDEFNFEKEPVAGAVVVQRR